MKCILLAIHLWIVELCAKLTEDESIIKSNIRILYVSLNSAPGLLNSIICLSANWFLTQITVKLILPTISKPLIALAYKKIPTVWCLKAKLEGDLAEENELISLKKAAGRGWRNSVMERRIYGRLD